MMVNDSDGSNEIEKVPSTDGSDDSGNGNGNQSSIEHCDLINDIDAVNPIKSYVRRRRCNENVQICEKKKKRETFRRISTILRKNECDRSVDEQNQLKANADIVRQINKRREHVANTRERVLEKEDPPEVIEAKAKKLADVLSRAQHLVCYTGAGISTSTKIPDYRGSQGIWTLLQQGKEIGEHDLSLAEPTFTHMSLFELHRRNILQYTLSQNCDGLHLRSGLPRRLLSEIHGNMYIEVCKHCKPNVEYWRLFDTTELTARYYHKTNRRCHFCFKPLIDTIVHFGERGKLKWPLNWESACKHAEKADVILCLGSSLKVLKKYTWLWQMDRPKNKRPKIYIVNLQWTPKDKNATLKINGKCDKIMKLVMDYMNIKVAPYDRKKDPIFAHASLLAPEEKHTVSQPMLKHHIDAIKIEKSEKAENTTDIDASKIEIKIESTDEPIKQMPENKDKVMMDLNSLKVEEVLNCSSNEKMENDVDVKEDTRKDMDVIEMESKKIESNKMELKDCSEIANNSNVPNLPQSNGDEKKLNPNELSPNTTTISSQSMDAQCSPLKSITKAIIEQSVSMKSIANDLVNGSIFNGNNHHINGDGNDERRDEDYYKKLINYYRAIEGVIPHWYDVNYAYSGLHSIIHPPPNEVDIWSTIIIPIFQLNRNLAECEFCFDNYAEDKCQFYRPSEEFYVMDLIRYRHGKRILCECCDYDDDDDDNFENDMDEEPNSLDEIDGSEELKTNSEEDDLDNNRSKRVKFDRTTTNTNGHKENGQRIVQPGWYGKGYRKTTTKRKKSRRSYQLP